MTTPVSRRARPAKAPLSREVIVGTALKLLDRDGMDALTMRRLAQELDTGPASLYVYVRNRDDLLELLLDAALGEVPLERGDAPWPDRLAELITGHAAALTRHRGLAFVALGRIPTGDNALLIVDRQLALLKEGGLDDRTASWAVDLLGQYAAGVAAEQSTYDAQGTDQETYVAAVTARFEALSPVEYPMVTALRGPLMSGSGDEREKWFLRVLLAGILATPA